MEQVRQYFELLVAVLPPEWWSFIDRYAVLALLLALVAVGAIKLIDWLDMRDGRRDVPIIGKIAPWVSIVLEAGVALIELGPVQLPRLQSLRKFKELFSRGRMLLGSPHPDDVK